MVGVVPYDVKRQSSTMATAAGVGISIRFETKKTIFHFAPSKTVQDVIAKAAAFFKVDLDERANLVLIHQGTRLPGRSKIQDVLRNCSTTCCFLQVSKKIESRQTSFQLTDNINPDEIGKYLGFCTTCNFLVRVRPLYQCSKCRKDGFILNNRPNLFDDDLDLVRGACSSCGCNTKPNITYQCAVTVLDNPHSAVFLPHLRENVEKLPCMNCGRNDDEIIRFNCNHTMCLQCFGDMCKMQLGCRGFKNYPELGYSICCPAGDPMCSSSPIADPHHFYLVDGKKHFYSNFQEKAFAVFCEEQKGVECQKCRNTLNMAQGQEAEVVPPACYAPETPVQAGGAWSFFSRLLQRTQSLSAGRKMRRQVTCSRCESQYCGECVQLWHEGDCLKLSAEQEATANRYRIDPKKAVASKWR